MKDTYKMWHISSPKITIYTKNITILPPQKHFPFFLKLLLSTYSFLPAHLTKCSVKFCPLYKQCFQFSLFFRLKPFALCCKKNTLIELILSNLGPSKYSVIFFSCPHSSILSWPPWQPWPPWPLWPHWPPWPKGVFKIVMSGQFHNLTMFHFSQALKLLLSETKYKKCSLFLLKPFAL